MLLITVRSKTKDSRSKTSLVSFLLIQASNSVSTVVFSFNYFFQYVKELFCQLLTADRC
jgi:hypothetical protein